MSSAAQSVPSAPAVIGARPSRGRAIAWTTFALVAGSAATLFFATAGPIDPLKDALFSLAIALDLSAIFCTWQAGKWIVPTWIAPYTHFVVRHVEGQDGSLTAWVRVPTVARPPMLWDNPLWRWLLVGLALLVTGTAVGLYAYQAPALQVYAAWVVGLVALLLAYLPWQRPGRPVPLGEALALMALLAVAFALRAARLAVIPLAVHPETARFGLEARRILHGDFPGWFSLLPDGLPAWAAALETLSMWLLGDSLVGLRAAGVIAGMLSVLGVYALGREGWHAKIGLLAALVLSVDVVHLHFSRLPLYLDPVPWVVWSVYFVVRGYRRRSPFSWALGGVCAALASNMYLSGYVVLPLLVLVILYLAAFHSQGLRQVRDGVLAMVLAFLVTLGPMLVTLVQEWPLLIGQLEALTIWNPRVFHQLADAYQATTFQDVLWAQVQRTFLTYQYYGDTSTQFGYPYPMLDALLAPLFLLGVGVATARLRHQGNFILTAWLVLGLVLGSVITEGAPYWPRLLAVTPANALAVALGAAWLLELFGGGRRWLEWAIGLTLVGLVAFAGWRGWNRYMDSVAFLAGERDFAARFMRSVEGRVPCFVEGAASLEAPEFAFLLADVEVVPLRPDHWAEDVAACAQRGGVVVALPQDRSRVLELQERFPGGRLEEVRGPTGSPSVVVYWLPSP